MDRETNREGLSMRKLVSLGLCTLAFAFGVSVASADVVTVNLTGHVTQVYDPSLAISVGAPVTATYSYDTLTTLDPSGYYHLASPPANVTVSVAGQIYQSQNDWSYLVQVTPNTPGTFGSSFNYFALAPESAGSSYRISVSFNDNSGGWPSSAALPTTAPSLSTSLGGYIGVNPLNSAGFSIQIDTVTLAQSLTISPASSAFVAQQNFDALVLLSSQIGITSMQASVGGTPIAFSYPGTCQLAAPNSTGRTALVCPNASAVLAGLGAGATQVDWQVVLADGSTVQQSVIWNLVL
jgi:hypothetical protein